MKKTTQRILLTGSCAISLLLLGSTNMARAEAGLESAYALGYASVTNIVLEDGSSLDIVMGNSPALPPGAITASSRVTRTSAFKTGDKKITGVPAFDWSYGASATAAAMIAGFYDNHEYPDMYKDETVDMPLTNAEWDANKTGVSNECPLSATKNGLDGRVSRGHVDDYYIDVDDPLLSPDPYVANGWTEHILGECTGDYMKTSKLFPGTVNSIPGLTEDINRDGAALFVLSGDGLPMTASDLESKGYSDYDAGYGLKLFYESRGNYEVAAMYNQYINPKKAYGFTYEQYKAEIDADRPVLLHLSGHYVVGIGYNDLTEQEVIFHDSWDHAEHTMTWGGTYNTVFRHDAVTIVLLEGTLELTWYKDSDGDGYSDGTNTTAHLRPTNYFLASELTAISGDCDDSNALLHPETTWYRDSDGDEFGNSDVMTQQCLQPTGYVLNDKDCDDTDPNITICFPWTMFLPAITAGAR